jgi:hypothetical protein
VLLKRVRDHGLSLFFIYLFVVVGCLYVCNPGLQVSGFGPLCAPTIIRSLTTDPKQEGRLTMEWNLQNCEPHAPFLFTSWFISGICHSDRQLAHTVLKRTDSERDLPEKLQEVFVVIWVLFLLLKEGNGELKCFWKRWGFHSTMKHWALFSLLDSVPGLRTHVNTQPFQGHFEQQKHWGTFQIPRAPRHGHVTKTNSRTYSRHKASMKERPQIYITHLPKTAQVGSSKAGASSPFVWLQCLYSFHSTPWKELGHLRKAV